MAIAKIWKTIWSPLRTACHDLKRLDKVGGGW